MSALNLLSQKRAPLVRLPKPQNVTYKITGEFNMLKLQLSQEGGSEKESHAILQHPHLYFTNHSFEDADPTPPETNNTAWARALRSPTTAVNWTGDDVPTVGQIWIIVYAILSIRPELEIFRIRLLNENSDELARQLKAVGLAFAHPLPAAPPGQPVPTSIDHIGQLVVSRSAFWQGAGSPFGPRPVWIATLDNNNTYSPVLGSSYPNRALDYTLTTRFPSAPVHAFHPVRPAKPTSGATIYSRYIPHLDEMFSMVALDWQNEEHVNYFHTWQNDPRVAQGWNETGTLEEHREYLRKTHVDPHQYAALAKFNDTFFAYFEIYWAKEDHVGAYYDAQDYDRGRHFLVGDARFRGPHRVKAWHTSLTHYMFLDEPRTNLIVGEPRATGAKVLAYDQANGYHIGKLIDLPHKRAALVQCPRERFFQSLPFEYEEESS